MIINRYGGGFGRRLLTGLLVTALTAVAAIVALPGAAQAALPGGRANYTVALMRNFGDTQSFVRLAEYSLRVDGSARADYWAWNAQTVTIDANRPSGISTVGCADTCTVWTTDGFQAAPKQLFGTWRVDDAGLHVDWSNGQTERWTITNQATITKLTLASHPTANRGWGWGSTFGFGSGLSAKQVFDARTKLSGPFSQNNYGAVLESETMLQLRPDASFPAALCSDNCINLSTPGRNKAFLGGTGADRRMYYNHELYEVHNVDCVVKGHLKPALQIIDDTGAFRGLIMVEASVYAKVNGSDILAIYDLNNID